MDFEALLQAVLIGIVTGGIYFVAASGLVLTYTTTGVFNFAHGAVGMVAVFLYWTLRVDMGWPTVLAVLLVLLVVAPLMGAGTERLMRSFHGAATGTVLVVTIGITLFLIGFIQFRYPPEGRNIPPLISNDGIRIVGVALSWDELFIVFVAGAVAIGLRGILYTTRTGVAMRAVVDNPALAGLNGAKPFMIARFAWILGFVLAALAGVLNAPKLGLDAIALTFLVVNAYAAAMVGRLKSLPMTFVGAMALGVGEGVLRWGVTEFELSGFWTRVPAGAPTILLFAALILAPEERLRVGRLVGRNEPRVPKLVESLWKGGLFIAVVGVLVPLVPSENLTDVTRGFVYATLMLSLVVLTGFSGQVSLGQLVFAGMGAWAMGSVLGGDSIVGILAAGLIAVPLGVLIALPALRLTGLYLALATFAFARLASFLIFDDPRVFGAGNQEVGRLDLGFVDFSGDRAYLFLAALVFTLIGIGVLVLRRSAFGRTLSAMRDSEAACATLGLDVRRTKLVVFALSSAIAGIGGAMIGGLNTTVGTIDFTELNNLPLFLLAVVGGITTVTGAMVGGALFALLPFLQSKSQELGGLVFLGIGIAAIALGKQPNGIAGVMGSWWESVRTARSAPPGPTAAVEAGAEPTGVESTEHQEVPAP